ncbi:hypothetical protein A0256_11425 [Mucilaginibacter sp. PAMC 26640]|nr:hypothetical protein A0256_11425 [Mucilaginibacter sp. PAMC 26640]
MFCKTLKRKIIIVFSAKLNPSVSHMKLFLLLIFIACCGYAHGQTSGKGFGVGLDLGIPSNSIYNIGFGGSGKAEVPLISSLSLSVTAGYTNFYYKGGLIGNNKTQDAAGFVPLKAGVKYYAGEGFYIEGETGVALATNYTKNTLFAFSLGPGFFIATGKQTGVDVGLRYENWGSGRLQQTAIRAAYRFNW